MERQYIFFRTARALWVFVVGIIAILAFAEAIRFVAPDEGWLAVCAVIFLAAATIVASFKVDAKFRRKSRSE